MMRATVAFTFVLAGGLTAAARDFADDSARLRRAFQLLSPSVVQIDVVMRDETPSRVSIDLERSACGTVVAPGLVIGPADLTAAPGGPRAQVASAEVTVAGGAVFPARLCGHDAHRELAFFAVDDPAFPGVPLEFAADDTLGVGDFFAAVRLTGPSFQRAPYLDAFLVSGELAEPRCALTTFAVADYLGAPVATFDGRVVGLVLRLQVRAASTSAAPTVFAAPFGYADDGRETVVVPASRFRAALAEPPRADVPLPEPPRPWLGLEVQPLLPALADALGIGSADGGVRICRVLPGSPAAAAALAIGDVVVELDGASLPAAAEEPDALGRRLRDAAPGDVLRFGVWRGGARREALVTVGTAPPAADAAATAESGAFGLVARDLVYADRADHRLPLELGGAVATGVRPTGHAGLGGLATGDIVREVDGQPVADARALCEQLDRAARERAPELVLFVIRGLDTRFIHVQPDWQVRAD